MQRYDGPEPEEASEGKPGIAADERAELDAARNGDPDAVERLMIRYKPLVRARAHAYRMVGADREDLVQEGMIGLFKAVRDYRVEAGAPFAAFADLCVTRQVMSAVKAAARKKHLPLNTYLSLSQPGTGEDAELPDAELREAESREPERQFIHREEARRIATVIEGGLSPFERQVIGLYLAGENYHAIAQRMQRSPKSIDNALQRIRRKIGMRLRIQKESV